MKDRSDDPSHHERTLLPLSYISLLLWMIANEPHSEGIIIGIHVIAFILSRWHCTKSSDCQVRVRGALSTLYGKKEGNALFNDALNTFYLRLYGAGHMVNDHLDSERGNPLPPHRLLLPINSKHHYMHHPTDRIAHTTAFITPVVEHWLEREIAQWVHPMKD